MTIGAIGNGFGPGGRLIWQQTVPDVRQGAWSRDDFDNPGTFAAVATGTGAAALTNANRSRNEFGVARLAVTAVADLAAVLTGSAAPLASPFAFGEGNVVLDMRYAMLNVSDGVNNFSARLGLIDSASAGTAADAVGGAYFESDYPNHANSPVWFACTSIASVRTKVSTGVVPVAGTHQRFRIFVLAAGGLVTSVMFFINDALVATILTNLPNSNGCVAAQVIKSLGAGAITTLIDYYEITTAFSTPR